MNDLQKAKAAAGWRERYAIKHGKLNTIYIRDHKCLKFTYSPRAEYQDANGATFDTVTGQWIN